MSLQADTVRVSGHTELMPAEPPHNPALAQAWDLLPHFPVSSSYASSPLSFNHHFPIEAFLDLQSIPGSECSSLPFYFHHTSYLLHF